eukprot:GILI01029323.1.p1 GENE.GILI01029323.1~~GILI01029323.1.p1  ORF type:complete len:288 (-),score=57.91 GILI01029323.1:109-942(-)
MFAMHFGDVRPSHEYLQTYMDIYGGGARDPQLPCYQHRKDITIPPMVSVKRIYVQGQGGAAVRTPREILASFRGAVISHASYSNGVRQALVEHYQGDPLMQVEAIHPKLAQQRNYTGDYIQQMENSTFCLSPPGWAPWSLRPFESLMLGCIPVIIGRHIALPWETLNLFSYDDIAVIVSEEEAKGDLKGRLSSFSPEEITARQENIKLVWRLFTYQRKRFPRRVSDPINFKEMDAFDLLLLEVAKRHQAIKAKLYSLRDRRPPPVVISGADSPVVPS